MNWYVFFIASFFFVWQNIYFGGNSFPMSDAELIADGITMLLFALSVIYQRGKVK